MRYMSTVNYIDKNLLQKKLNSWSQNGYKIMKMIYPNRFKL